MQSSLRAPVHTMQLLLRTSQPQPFTAWGFKACAPRRRPGALPRPHCDGRSMTPNSAARTEARRTETHAATVTSQLVGPVCRLVCRNAPAMRTRHTLRGVQVATSTTRCTLPITSTHQRYIIVHRDPSRVSLLGCRYRSSMRSSHTIVIPPRGLRRLER